jgi:hypothetical protein
MTPSDPEQFRDVPLLPTVTADTVREWQESPEDMGDQIEGAFHRFEGEQPLLMVILDELVNRPMVGEDEKGRTLVAVTTVVELLRRQAAADRRNAQQGS